VDLQNDPQNCGRCGKSCAGGDCSGGLCVAVEVMAAAQPYDIGQSSFYAGFVSGGTVYLWEEESGGPYDLRSTSSAPANPPATGLPALQSDTGPTFGAVTFDSNNIYETEQPANKGDTGQVLALALSGGGTPTKLFTLPSGPNDSQSNPTDYTWGNIALGNGAIYVTGKTNLNGILHPVPDETTIFQIATPVTDPTSTPTAIYTHQSESVTKLAVFGNATAGDHLFWLDYQGNRQDSDAGFGSDVYVYTAPVNPPGTPVLLDDAVTNGASFASDGTYVYWTEVNDAGRLMRCPLANLDPAHVQPVADVSSAQDGIVVQGQYAWVMELSDPGPISRIDTGTGAKDTIGNRTVGASIKNSYLFGIDSAFIYMGSIDGPIYRLPSAP
jgi:hypothetical protein